MNILWHHNYLRKLSKDLWDHSISPESCNSYFRILGMDFISPWGNFNKTLVSLEDFDRSVKYENSIKKAIFCMAHGINVWLGEEDRPNSKDYQEACDFLKITKSISPCEHARRLLILEKELEYKEIVHSIELDQLAIKNQVAQKICHAKPSWTMDAIVQSCFDSDAPDFVFLRKDGDRRYIYSKKITDFFSLGISMEICVSNTYVGQDFFVKTKIFIFKNNKKFNINSEKGFFEIPMIWISPFSSGLLNYCTCINMMDVEFSVKIFLKCYDFCRETIETSIVKAFP